MIGGQVVDVKSSGKKIDGEKLEFIYRLKTGALIEASMINIPKMKSDLARYGIQYDQWFFESSLHDSGYVADTVQALSLIHI